MEAFNDIFEDCTSLGTKISKDNYLSEGKYIVVDQGQNIIAGYTNEEDGLYEDVPAIVFGDHTRIIKYVDEPFFLGADGVKLLKSKKKDANYKYLYYALKNARIPDTGYNRHFKWLKEVNIEYPEPDKQQKIVEVLDKISRVIEERKLELQQLDELIKARFVEMFGTPLLNEKGWDVVAAGECCSVITDGSHFSPQGQEEGYPMLSVKDMRNDGFHYESCKRVSEEDFQILKKQGCIPKEKDVLISKDGSYFYYGFVLSEYREQAILSSIAMLRPDLGMVNPYYLCNYMLSERIVELVSENYVTGAALKRVILKGIKQIPVMMPPIVLQNEFETFVKQVDKSKVIVQKSLEETQVLFDSLMQEYFG